MVLLKFDDFYDNSDHDSADANSNIKHFDVYARGNDGTEKAGSVSDILVDATTGRFRYFVVDTGFWIFGKKVLLPVGRADIHFSDKQIHVQGLTKDQVKNLPDFDDLQKVDYDYEERVRGIYRPMATTPGVSPAASYDRNTYTYDREPSLYNINEQTKGGQTLKLYEERLIADKKRHKTGEVTVGKKIETQTDSVTVPVEKERVVIEKVAPTNLRPTNTRDAFREGEVAHMEVYEETPDIHKETVLREQVNVKKQIERDTKTTKETLRREELDLDSQGHPVVDKRI